MTRLLLTVQRRLAPLLLTAAAACPVDSQQRSTGPTAALDPAHAVGVLPGEIKWRDTGRGTREATLFGNPPRPGPYGLLLRWTPGHMSRPHRHSSDRWIYVVSGTWWASTSERFDLATAIPFPAGSFVTHVAGKIHWDGAKDEEVVLELGGIGPVVTTRPAEP